MNENNKKKCFISLPIAGRENDVFDRVEVAKEEVKRLGFEPISPLDLNELHPDNIDGHEYSTSYYMGRDIEALIDCDAIYCCEGWKKSKGCQVERKTAEVYKLEIFEQNSNFSDTLENQIKRVYNSLLTKYRYQSSQLLQSDPELISTRNAIKRFINDMDCWFGVYLYDYEWASSFDNE